MSTVYYPQGNLTKPKRIKLTSEGKKKKEEKKTNKLRNNKILEAYKHAIHVYGNNSDKITQGTKIKPIHYVQISEGFSGNSL